MRLPDYPPPLLTPFAGIFYDGVAQGELRLPVCPDCGAVYWYPPAILPCHPDTAPGWRAVSPQGVVYSFTRIERSLLPDADPASVPYTLVMVHPIDAPAARVIGVLADADDGPVQCGDIVRFQPARVKDHWIPAFVRDQGDPQPDDMPREAI
ncbi:Rubredoxin-like zinc ribbon domain [Sphingobium faniae]|nr:Rubredoxin-like zinc ribbon domain [Sphingobium faniae]